MSCLASSFPLRGVAARAFLALGPLLAALPGCAADVDAPTGVGEAALAGNITHTEAGGVTSTRVNAAAHDAWIYLDLGWKTEVFPSSPTTSADWDLSFNRFNIKSNGGASGVGGVAIAALPDASFEALTTAPETGYATDGDEPVLAGWYTYDPVTHMLSPTPTVFVVRSIAGDYYKLQFVGYYDEAGSSGYPSFRWAPIDPPQQEG